MERISTLARDFAGGCLEGDGKPATASLRRADPGLPAGSPKSLGTKLEP
jgi:hypothetical protein